jgi:hypothetical protein
MQSLQQASNNPIRYLGFSFQFFSAVSNNHPSGIRPSKKGNNTFDAYGASRSGKVKLTDRAPGWTAYAWSYTK